MEGMKTFLAGLDDELYNESFLRVKSDYDCPPLQYLAQKAWEAGIGPDDKTLARRENHYLKKFGVGNDDLYRSDKIKAYAHDMCVLNEIFAACGITMEGPGADTLGKAFTVTTLRPVFPEYYDAMIVAGIMAMPLLDTLVSHSETANRTVFDHVTLTETDSDKSTGLAAEFTSFQETTVSASGAPVKVKKFAQVLKESDEALQNSALPVAQRTLERIGRKLMIDITDFAMDVTLLGDGTAGASAATAAAVSGSPTFSDWTSLLYAFAIGYEPSDFIATGTVLQKMVTSIPEFKDPFAWSRPFQVSGKPPEVFGLMPHRWDSLGSSGWATTKVLVIQKNLALAQYNNGGLRSEQYRVANGQWTGITTSLSTAFAIWDSAARRVGTGYA